MHVLYYDITITLVLAKVLSFFCSLDLKEKTLLLSTEKKDLFQTKKANCAWLLSRDQSQPKFQSQDPFSVNQGLKTCFSLLFTVNFLLLNGFLSFPVILSVRYKMFLFHFLVQEIIHLNNVVAVQSVPIAASGGAASILNVHL